MPSGGKKYIWITFSSFTATGLGQLYGDPGENPVKVQQKERLKKTQKDMTKISSKNWSTVCGNW